VIRIRPAQLFARLGVGVVVLLTIAGCAATADGSEVASTPSGGAYEVVPEPGRTIDVSSDKVGELVSLAGYRMAVVGDGSPTSVVLVEAARGLAARSGAELIELTAETPDEAGIAQALTDALAVEPDLVVGLGEGTVDVFSFETAQWLDQEFLVVGAQLAEPTSNVTAVIWDGATSRGSAASADGALDASALTADLAEAAMVTGVRSVRAGETGVVLRLERD
jgi:hypothetical protein